MTLGCSTGHADSVAASQQAEDELRVLPAAVYGVAPSEMMQVYLRRLASEALDRRDAAYARLKTPQDLAAHRERMRAFLTAKLGGLPERTPLNARVVGAESRGEFRVERVIYESLPGYFVAALCYVPTSPEFQPPYPAVLVLCGHQNMGVGKEAYDDHCALFARNGFVVLCIDAIGQGERHQVLAPDGRPTRRYRRRRPRFHSSLEHMHVGVGSILVGRNAASYFVWDAMRAIDYLETRGDVDANRMGCFGGSGGGTQTAYVMALDDRVKCASPRNYMTSLRRLVETIGPQDAEQNIHGQIAEGMGHGDFILMAAPCAVLLLVGTHDSFDIDGAWETLREAKRAYARLGIAERVDIFEADAGHGATDAMLAGLVRWMRRWLQGVDEREVLGLKERAEAVGPMHCTPRGQVLLLEGARSTFDLNMDLEERLAEKRRRFWEHATNEEAMAQVRELSGIRRLEELPPLQYRHVGTIKREGCRVDKLLLEPEPGIWLPALRFVPLETRKLPVLYVDGRGKHVEAGPGARIERLAEQGHTVLAFDMRGLGETARVGDREDYVEFFGPAHRDASLAYMLGRSFLAMRAEDILACARFLTEQTGIDSEASVQLIAIGEAGPPALHAAALEPDLFRSIRLERSLVSWREVVRTPVSRNQLTNCVHGVLEVYDLPDLLATLPPGKACVSQPVDAECRPEE